MTNTTIQLFTQNFKIINNILLNSYINYFFLIILIILLFITVFELSFLKIIILLEIIFLIIALLFVLYSLIMDNPEGILLALYIFGIAASETALGLSLFIIWIFKIK